MCALKATVLAAVAKAEQAVGDLKIAANHVRKGAATYTPGSASAPTYAETITPVNIVFTRYEAKEIDGDRIRSTDWKGLVFGRQGLPTFLTSDVIRIATATNDVPAGDYRINYDDKVMAGDVVALHQLHLRQ